MTERALRKKMQKKFKPGDLVTWGTCLASSKVLRVEPDGVWVDASDQPDLVQIGVTEWFVTWSGGRRGKGPGKGAELRRVGEK